MDDDDSILTLNLIVGAIALTFEIGIWLIAAVCIAVVAVFELFFED